MIEGRSVIRQLPLARHELDSDNQSVCMNEQSTGDGIFAAVRRPGRAREPSPACLYAALRLQEPSKIPTYQMAALLRRNLDLYARLRAVPFSTVDAGRNE
jgi:hypothetical protein